MMGDERERNKEANGNKTYIQRAATPLGSATMDHVFALEPKLSLVSRVRTASYTSGGDLETREPYTTYGR